MYSLADITLTSILHYRCSLTEQIFQCLLQIMVLEDYCYLSCRGSGVMLAHILGTRVTSVLDDNLVLFTHEFKRIHFSKSVIGLRISPTDGFPAIVPQVETNLSIKHSSPSPVAMKFV